MTAENPKEGDIFRWRYKDEKPSDLGGYRRYHCKSQMAIFTRGTLHDTFWGSTSWEDRVDFEKADLVFLGNMNEMQKISPWERVFYRDEDIVDMNHSNNSGAPVYVKVGASRDAETMKAYFEYKIERTKSEIDSAHRRINECEEALGVIASGDLSRHFPVYS